MPPKSMKRKMGEKHNKTKKICPIGLKPFEEDFSKKLAAKEAKKLRTIETYKKKVFAKELLSKFAPSSIKPNNNFYDYSKTQYIFFIFLTILYYNEISAKVCDIFYQNYIVLYN